jgi:hypothetical protein
MKITKQRLQQIIKEEISNVTESYRYKKKRPYDIKIGERVMVSVVSGRYGDHGGVVPGTIIATGQSTRVDAPEWFAYRDEVEKNKFEKSVLHVSQRMTKKDKADPSYMEDANWLSTAAAQEAQPPIASYPGVKLDVGTNLLGGEGFIGSFHVTQMEGTPESTADGAGGPTGIHQGYFLKNPQEAPAISEKRLKN